MAKKEKEPQITLTREYIVPLRREWMKVAYYKRAARAIKALKKFIAKHMKVEERDLRKVKLDKWLNNEIWYRGIRKPLHKVKVKAEKYNNGIVKVSLAEIPEILKFKIDREKKLKEAGEKIKAEKKEEKKEEIKEKTEEEKKEIEEKEKSGVEAGLKEAETQATQVKHETKMKRQPKHQFRQALRK